MITVEDAKLIARTIDAAVGSALAKLASPSDAKSVTVVSGSKAKVAELPPDVAPANGDGRMLNADQIERLYREFKARFINDAKIDPILLHLIQSRPEIVVEIERQVVRVDGTTLKGRVARLIAGGYFGEMRLTGTVKKELMRTGPEPNGGNLSTTLGGLVTDGFLTRDGDGYIAAPGCTVSEEIITKP